MSKLQGRTALITGGTTGIGLATTKLFQKEGARVAITGQNESRLQQAKEELGHDVLAIRANVAAVPEIEKMVAVVKEEFGGLDILFVNAGIGKFGPFTEIDEATFDEQFNVNYKGAFFTIQKAVPILHNNASVVLNTSINNQLGMLGSSIYAASKAALRSLARTLSAELIDRGIRVNAVSPGPITTPIYQKLGFPQEQLDGFVEDLKQKIPMHRFGTPEEIAKIVLFFATEESSFILGEELVADGGFTQL